MKNAKKVLISIQRLTELKNISLVDAFLLFSDSMLSGDYSKFKRYGFKVVDNGCSEIEQIMFQINSRHKETV